ncbi:MAG TPA: hypothetical protein ENO24_01975 [Chloroflexi bacterium]|nr:hypothetical protein [Chloroflexota bacterium]
MFGSRAEVGERQTIAREWNSLAQGEKSLRDFAISARELIPALRGLLRRRGWASALVEPDHLRPVGADVGERQTIAREWNSLAQGEKSLRDFTI